MPIQIVNVVLSLQNDYLQWREHRINENKEMLFALGMVSCSHAFNNNEQFEYQSTVQLTKTTFLH